jgi:hypothetical protein
MDPSLRWGDALMESWAHSQLPVGEPVPAQPSDFTISSTIFLASDSSIIVLSR